MLIASFFAGVVVGGALGAFVVIKLYAAYVKGILECPHCDADGRGCPITARLAECNDAPGCCQSHNSLCADGCGTRAAIP